jgi:hypothetical protein
VFALDRPDIAADFMEEIRRLAILGDPSA